MVVDFREVNKRVLPLSMQLPNPTDQASQFLGLGHFAKLDFIKCFHQIPTGELGSEVYVVLLPWGTYKSKKLQMGPVDAPVVCQDRIVKSLGDLFGNGVALWLDDLLVGAGDTMELVDKLLAVLWKLNDSGWHLNPGKADLYSTRIRWCGKIYSDAGVMPDPERVQGLRAAGSPRTVADVAQWVGALEWLRPHLPHFSPKLRPLREWLEAAYKRLGSRRSARTRTAAVSDFGWNEGMDEVFQECKDVLTEVVLLSHRDVAKRLVVLTDASDEGWGAVIFQYGEEEFDLELQERNLEILAVMSGVWRGASTRWSTVDREAFPLIQVIQKQSHLLYGAHPFEIYGDSKTVMYILDPERVVAHPKMATLSRVRRWGLLLQQFQYLVVHIDGVENLWGDMLSRWATPADGVVASALFVVSAVASGAGVGDGGLHTELHDLDGDGVTDNVGAVVNAVQVDWRVKGLCGAGDFNHMHVDAGTLRAAQRSRVPAASWATPSINIEGVGVTYDEGDDIYHFEGKIFVVDDEALRKRCLVLAHAGLAGHRSRQLTLSRVQQHVSWPAMEEDVAQFVSECLLCRVCRGPVLHKRVPGHVNVGSERGEVVHWDFLHVVGAAVEPYLLVMQDGFTGWVEFYSCKSPTSEVAVEALLEWSGRYGPPKVVVSDSGSHFAAGVVAELARRLGLTRHLVVANSPWANGSVERLNREVVYVLRALVQEARLPVKQYKKVLPLVQSALNSTPSRSRGGVPPRVSFLGQSALTALDVAFAGNNEFRALDMAKFKQSLAELRGVLDDLHVRVAAGHQAAGRIGGTLPRGPYFQPGDYVLVSVVRKNRNKLVAIKTGPMIVAEVLSTWVYKVRDVVTGTVSAVHARRLEFYADANLNVTEEVRTQIQYQVGENEVERFTDHRRQPRHGWQLRVRWWGYGEAEDTWESVATMVDDTPVSVHEYVKVEATQRRRDFAQLKAAVLTAVANVGDNATEEHVALRAYLTEL